MVRFPELLQMLPLSQATIYRMMARGEFPQSVKLTRPFKKQAPVGWPLSQIEKYLREQPEAPRVPANHSQTADCSEPRQRAGP
jgi:predicted DNA-binding transcriptional regulator AlpA